jgi:hypothetical protein
MECWGQQRWRRDLPRGTHTALPHTVRLIDGQDGTSCGAMKGTRGITTMAPTNKKLGDMEHFTITGHNILSHQHTHNNRNLTIPSAKKSIQHKTISSSEAVIQTVALLSSRLDHSPPFDLAAHPRTPRTRTPTRTSLPPSHPPRSKIEIPKRLTHARIVTESNQLERETENWRTE